MDVRRLVAWLLACLVRLVVETWWWWWYVRDPNLSVSHKNKVEPDLTGPPKTIQPPQEAAQTMDVPLVSFLHGVAPFVGYTVPPAPAQPSGR